MLARIARTTILVLIATVSGSLMTPGMAQQKASSTDRGLVVINYSGDMAGLLAQLTQSLNLTIGLEVDSKQPKTNISIYVLEATPADIMNAIVTSAPAYQWREHEGSIEVLPNGSTNPLLDSMISNFQVSEVDQKEAFDRLMNLPEVQANLRANNLKWKGLDVSLTESKSQKFSLDLSAVTMRQAFSRIVEASGKRFWIYRELGNGLFSLGN